MTVGATSGGRLAVRPGVVYTGTGQATFGLPAGKYTIYAGRGFAYGIDSASVTAQGRRPVRKTLAIRREVPTPGYVSCDTHVHTLTHSGHGDCHPGRAHGDAGRRGHRAADRHRSQRPHRLSGQRPSSRAFASYFTPVIGNEVTTPSAISASSPCRPAPRSPITS